MANNIVEMDRTKVSAQLAATLGGADANDDLSAGVSGGFSVISFRGSKWRVKHGGEETLLTDNLGETIPSLRVVMLKANRHVSKNYYEGGYVEGSTDAPSCFSVDGTKPDASVENPVNPVCATCPKGQYGSRITESGSKSKACSDSRRVAVVPEGDWKNEQFGGPMLLRVPAASLTDLGNYGKAMKAKGFPYNTIITRIGFDPDTAYPKLKFKAVRPINAEEADELMGLLADKEYRSKIDYVLAEATEFRAAEDDSTVFEDPVPVVKPAAAKKAAPKPPVDDTPDPAPSSDDMDLDEILSKLDSLE